MPGPSLVVEMSGEEAKLWAALQKITLGQQQVAGGFDKMGAAAKKADAEERQLARSAARTLREIQTPQEKYNATVADLTTLKKAGKLNEEQYGLAVAKAKQEMIAAGQATDAARRRRELQSQATREAKLREEELGLAAKRVLTEIQTPQERYNARLRELGTLLRAGKIDQEQFGTAARRAKGELEASGKAGHGAFGPAFLRNVSSITAALGLTGGLAGAVRLVTEEYQAYLRVQERAKEASMTVADAQIKALRNLGATSKSERDEFTGAIEELAAETGVPERDLYMRASSALSARGALSVRTALDAVRESARLVPESAEEGTAVAGAALDLAKITGIEEASKNIGLLMSIGQTARITQVGPLAENVAPAVTGLTARGGTAREAGAIFSALTGGMADPTGRRSATAAITLGEELAKYLPETDRYEFKDGERVLATAATGLKTTLDRLQYLQAHPAAAEEFLAGASFEKKAQAPVEQLVTGQGPAAVALTDYLQRIPSAAQAGPLYEQRLAVQRGGELQGTAEFGRAVDTVVERLGTADQRMAKLGIIREKFTPIMEDVGMGALGSKLSGLAAMAGGDLSAFARQIESRRERLLAPGPRESTEWLAAAQGGAGASLTREPSEVEKRQAYILQQLLDAIRDAQKSDREASKQAGQQQQAAADKLSAAAGRMTTMLEQFAAGRPAALVPAMQDT